MVVIGGSFYELVVTIKKKTKKHWSSPLSSPSAILEDHQNPTLRSRLRWSSIEEGRGSGGHPRSKGGGASVDLASSTMDSGNVAPTLSPYGTQHVHCRRRGHNPTPPLEGAWPYAAAEGRGPMCCHTDGCGLVFPLGDVALRFH
jgi:hypothetical protein